MGEEVLGGRLGEHVVDKCPACNGMLEAGHITTDDPGGAAGGLMGGGSKKAAKLVWQAGQGGGLLAGARGDDVSQKSSHRDRLSIPAHRCKRCRLVVFQY
jgi:hypothetical protein